MAPSASKRHRGKPAKKQQTLEAIIEKFDASASPVSRRPNQQRASRKQAQAHVSFMPNGASNRAKAPVPVDCDSSEEDERDEDGEEPPAAQAVGTPHRSVTKREATLPTEGDDGSDDEEPTASKEFVNPRPSSAKRKAVVLSEDEDDDDVPVATPARRRRAVATVRDDDDDDDDQDSDSDVRPSTAKKRRLMRRHSTPSSPEPVATPSSKGRLRSTPASRSRRSQREKRMELLRRRRNGENVTELEQIQEPSGDEGESHRALYDTDSDLQVLKEFEDDEEEEEGSESADRPAKEPKQTQPSPTKPKSVLLASSDGQDSDGGSLDSFIDDEDGLIGAPDISAEIPLEFTSQANKPMKALFKDVIDWLVQSRINPAFDRDNAIYRLAWRKLDYEVQGLASSKFSSSAWTVEFQKSLQARPRIDNFEVGFGSHGKLDLDDTCMACNRTNHPATRVIRFSGKPYNRQTLEDVEQSDSDESDSEPGDGGRRVDRDENGSPIAPEGKDWFCGVVCAGNAETAHQLYHWRYWLKEWVDSRLRRQGHMTAKKLEKRERLSAKRRRKRADKIVDSWEESGMLRSLYDEFKRMLESARVKSTTGHAKRRR